jgi:hypothetical protein
MSDIDWSKGDDLGDMLAGGSAAPRALPTDAGLARIRDTVPEFVESCPKCRGTGRFVSYSGRSLGECFACKGRGKRTFKTSPDDRQQARQAAADRKERAKAGNWEAFAERNADVAAWIVAKAPGFDFAASMREAVERFGDLTANQAAAVARCMARDAERDAAKAAARQAVAAASVDMDAGKVKAAFDAARAAGLSRIKLTVGRVTITRAADTGRNPGALYVKAAGEYAGKIVDGRFTPSREAAGDSALIAELRGIFADPAAAARTHGQQTGSCSCCGRTLTDPVSIENGIGPICAGRFAF